MIESTGLFATGHACAVANQFPLLYSSSRMNFLGVLMWIWLSVMLALVSTGCASKRPMVSAWCAPEFSSKKTDTIALTEQIHPTPGNVAVCRSLTAELQREGFTIVSPDRADYLLACVLDEESEIHKNNHAQPIFNPMTQPGLGPRVGGASGGVGYYSNTHLSPAPLPNSSVTYVTTREVIRLYLYTNPKTHDGKFLQVWQGNINADGSGSAASQQTLLRTLLGFWGREYNGQVDLKKEE